MKYFVECYPDEVLLASVLERRSRSLIHGVNKPEVLKSVKKAQEAMGLIDEDPDSAQPSIINELREVEVVSTHLMKRSAFPSNGNLVVTLSPRLEEWVLGACGQSKIIVEKYGLPRDPNLFHDIVNSKLDNFSRLVSDLKKTSERVQLLENWVRHPTT